MVFYQADGWSWSAAQLLWEEARSLKEWAARSSLGDSLSGKIIESLKEELKERYGPKAGPKLHQEFLRALRDASDLGEG